MHGIEVIKIAPIFLEPVRGRQGLGVVSEMVLAELACGVAKIVQELGECRCTCPQVGRASGNFRQGHANARGFMPVKKAVRPAVQLCSA